MTPKLIRLWLFVASGGLTVGGASSLNGNVNLGNDIGDSITIGTGGSPVSFSEAVIRGGSPLVFEGAGIDTNKLTLQVADPTGARTLTLPDRSGTIITSGDS
jgi:hypothetical protein